jgi:hypothetical protein
MSVDLFIPTFWSNLILHRLKISLAYASPYCVNHDYEGEITDAGDSVKIHGIGDPEITDYVKNVVMDEPDTLDDFETTLIIDQAKKFNFKIDDIDTKQTQPKVVAEAMDRAAYGLALTADQFVAAKMLAAVAAQSAPSGESVSGTLIGTTAAPKAIAPATGAGGSEPSAGESAYEFLVDLGVILDEQKIPRTPDRFCVVPPWMAGLLAKDWRFIGYGGASGNTVLTDGFAGDAGANGLAGRAAGFNVIVSLDTPTQTFDASIGGHFLQTSADSTANVILAGVPQATSFANQIVKTEALRHQNQFADILRGLHVYGSNVTWPERLVAAYTAPGSGS